MQKIFIGFLLFLVTSLPSYAQVFFYRMDSRPPDNIFANGFDILGLENNLYLHVEGETCYSGSRTSNFVSTSSDESFSVDWGAALNAGTTFYVYRIRPDSTFYNTYNSLMSAYNSTRNEIYSDTASRFQFQREWVSHGRISHNQIIDVVQYTSNGSGRSPTRVIGYSNPNYQSTPTTPNDSSYLWNYSEDNNESESLCSSSCSESSPIKDNKDIKKTSKNWFSCKNKMVNIINFFIE